jgi:hypothetical protein
VNEAGRTRFWVVLIFAACICVGHAQDARIAVFDRYNHATTYDDIRPILSEVLAQQYASIVSRNPERLPTILAQQQLTSYRPRIVEIDESTSFLVLEDVTSKSSRGGSTQAYLMSKGQNSAWTLANRMLPESVIKSLWTTRFAAADFVQASSCAIDDREIKTQSVLAIREQDTIQIRLYPFTFSPADLEYWRQASGLSVRQEAVAGSHFQDRASVVCRLVVKIDGPNRLSLQNVGFDDSTTSPARSSLWQPARADVDVPILALEKDTIKVVTAGAVETAKDRLRWNVNIRVPVWQKGL